MVLELRSEGTEFKACQTMRMHSARIPAGVDFLLNTLAFVGLPEISGTAVTMTKS